MRIEIKFEILNNNIISFDYKRKISTILYNIIDVDNSDLSKKLHDDISISDYTISNINFLSGVSIDKKLGYKIRGKYFSIIISTFNQNLINSIKKTNKIFTLNDKNGDILLKMSNIKQKKEDDNLINKKFICDSFCLIKKIPNKNYKISFNKEEFDTAEFKEAFYKNLIRKYKKITNKDIDFDIKDMNIEIKTIREKLENLKFTNGKKISIKYYKIEFYLDCPIELKKIAYVNGIGSYNKLGFGYTETR